jgi:pimeloyl-ACP methyl ester carboxylesterase
MTIDRYVETNGIRIHYLDHPGSGPPVILLPGLTANAHSFDGLIQAGLSPAFRVLAVDLRGRGLSDKPAGGYSMRDHAEDVVGVLDGLGVAQSVVGGHSFGGLLTLYLAANYPQRVSHAILIDCSGSLVNPTSRALIQPALERLGRRFDSWEAYVQTIRSAPYFQGWWEPAIESYLRADVMENDDGSVQQRSRPENIIQAIDGAQNEEWARHLAAVRLPAILLHSRGAYGGPGSPPIVPDEHAAQTVAALPNCRYAEIPGNHMTMLFGNGASIIVRAIEEFLRLDRGPTRPFA